MTRTLLAALAFLFATCGAAATTLSGAPPKRPSSVAPALINHGSRGSERIAITFDADMTREMLADLRSGKVKSWYDARIVRYLRATHTPATIFLTGLWTKTYPDVVGHLPAIRCSSWRTIPTTTRPGPEIATASRA